MAKIYIFKDEYVYPLTGTSYPEIINSMIANKTYYLSYNDIVGSTYVRDLNSVISINGINYNYYTNELTSTLEYELYVSLYYEDEAVEEDQYPLSFNGQMAAIADAIRQKCNIPYLMNINSMIVSLNSFLSANNKVDISEYNENDFDSCLSKLASVIRTKGGIEQNLKLIEMRDAILALENGNPLTLYLVTYKGDNSISIEINSNAYLYESFSGTVEWHGENSGFLYSENIESFDGVSYNFNIAYASSDGENIFAKVTVYGGGYSKTTISDSQFIIGS